MVQLLANGVATQTVTASSTYFINGVNGGSGTLGTISAGLYVSPGSIASNFPVTLNAQYIYQGQTLNAVAIINLITFSWLAQITVSTQLNIFLGDGRFGYVPAGTTSALYPGDYLFVKFAEKLDGNTKVPDPTYQPNQLLSLQSENAWLLTTDTVINSLADEQVQPNGSILSTRTVVLAFCDPSDGNVYSMWDIADYPF